MAKKEKRRTPITSTCFSGERNINPNNPRAQAGEGSQENIVEESCL
jgi:hypothetical protein